MYQICAGQIKAARAILNWSQEDLASTTGLSISTIRNLELGFISPRNTTTNVVRQAVEDAGLEFIESEGVRRRANDVKIYQGVGSADAFFDDLTETVKKKGGEIVTTIKSQKLMAQTLGLTERDNADRLGKLNTIADVKCLFSEANDMPILLPRFQFRGISKHYVGPVPYYVYGDKHALVLMEDRVAFKFIVFRSASLAQSYRNHFAVLWESATPFLGHTIDEKRLAMR
jgi:transcriptional regulator with XRE-family HTH domain